TVVSIGRCRAGRDCDRSGEIVAARVAIRRDRTARRETILEQARSPEGQMLLVARYTGIGARVRKVRSR
ncbi:MAG TPA: hypothetical protein PKA95_08135, partial [Thermomicrobiales bacterium]|nr:hypothetical protein [Thermomicrobiales bacterium]